MLTKHAHILLVIISFFFAGTLKSQSLNESLDFAHKQFEQKHYALALKEYQRVFFFDTIKANPDLHYSIGECFLATGDLNRAVSSFDNSYYLYKNDSLKYNSLFKRIHTLLVMKRFNIALIDLLGVQTENEFWLHRKNLYLGICYFGIEDFENSEKHFLLSIDESDTEVQEFIKNSFDDKKRMFRPNPKTAKVMSMIVPGSGQMISGEILEGINSALLCDALAVLWLYTAYRYSLIDATISVFPWFYRYYEGGYKHAETMAKNKRQENRSEVYQELLMLVSGK